MHISNLTSSYHIFSSLCIKFGTKVMASTNTYEEKKILYFVEFLISERSFLFHWTSEMEHEFDAVYKFDI